MLQALDVTVLGARFPEVQSAQLRQVDGVFALLRLLTLLAFALAGILVVNTVRSAVAEQTAVIGTMKAMGGTRATILRGYLVTVAIYGIAGTVVGVVLGVAVGHPARDAPGAGDPADTRAGLDRSRRVRHGHRVRSRGPAPRRDLADLGWDAHHRPGRTVRTRHRFGGWSGSPACDSAGVPGGSPRRPGSACAVRSAGAVGHC